jgi:hypothetical protein
MVRICHHIPDANQRKPDAGAASILYNATHRKNTRHGIIAAAREVCKATCRLGDGWRLILRQRVRGSARAVRALRNTRVFQTETRVVADDVHSRGIPDGLPGPLPRLLLTLGLQSENSNASHVDHRILGHVPKQSLSVSSSQRASIAAANKYSNKLTEQITYLSHPIGTV